jgi:hypothetical protein
VTLQPDDPLAVAAVTAIHAGDVAALRRLLEEHAGLANARIGSDDASGITRTLLHVATDWPGHFPNGAETVAALAAAGADVNARFTGPHAETPLHWAASSGDIAVLDALLDAGADIEAPGAVVGGGTPLSDAAAFGQWSAAHRLVARGANTVLWESAALGLMDRVDRQVAAGASGDEITRAFWCAPRGGRVPARARRGRQLDRLRRPDPARRRGSQRGARARRVAAQRRRGLGTSLNQLSAST